MADGKIRRVLIRPGNSIEEHRQAAIDMFRALRAREPNEDEIRDLDLAVESAKREEVVRELKEELGRTPTEQEVNLYIAQADSLGEY